MIKVEIKVPPGVHGLSAAVAAALPEIANAVRNDIVTFAGKELKTSLLEYRRGVQVQDFDVSPARLSRGGKYRFAIVALSGWLANAVEQGWAGGDLVPLLVNGRSGRTAKDGSKYATIRFRHTKPGTTGMVGTEMGSMEAARGHTRVGKEIAKRAQRLSPNSGRLSRTQALNAGALTMQGRATGAAPHAGPIYEGMMRRSDSAGTTYETYRRASTKVAGKWLHPGITAKGFFLKAAERIDGHARLVIANHINGLSS
jgi:hypothetical protein